MCTVEMDNEYQIRKNCAFVIKNCFKQEMLLKYIKSIDQFKKLQTYSLDDKTLLGLYYELIGTHPDYTLPLREKYGMSADITDYGIVELFALSYLLNTTLLISKNDLKIKIKHPIVSNGSYIDIIKKYGGDENYLFIINHFI
jgi:hypothetical protein